MEKINSFLSPDWIFVIDERFEMEPDERLSLPLYEIIRSFKSSIEANQQGLDAKEKLELARKVKILSEEKLEYYRSSRFGFIKRIFSVLRNGWLMGRWQSSGQLGLELSQQVINQANLEQSGDEDSEAIPTWIKKKILLEKKKQACTETTEKISSSIPTNHIKNPVQEESEAESTQTLGCEKISFEEQILSKFEQINQAEQQNDTQDVDSESDQINSAERGKISSIVENLQPAQPPKLKIAKEEMIETLQIVWESASAAEKAFVLKIWEVMMSGAEIISWKPTGKANEYQLGLKREVFGNHPQIPIGYLVLKQNMKVAFSEKYDLESGCYKHILSFPDYGVCYRVGVGWLSKDTPIKSIMIEEDLYQDIWCSGEALGQQFKTYSNEILYFLRQMQWS